MYVANRESGHPLTDLHCTNSNLKRPIRRRDPRPARRRLQLHLPHPRPRHRQPPLSASRHRNSRPRRCQSNGEPRSFLGLARNRTSVWCRYRDHREASPAEHTWRGGWQILDLHIHLRTGAGAGCCRDAGEGFGKVSERNYWDGVDGGTSAKFQGMEIGALSSQDRYTASEYTTDTPADSQALLAISIQFFGPEEQARHVLAPFFDLNPINQTQTRMSFDQISDSTDHLDKKGGYKYLSSTGRRKISATKLADGFRFFADAVDKRPELRKSMVGMSFYNPSRMQEVPDESTAWGHRNISAWA